MANRKEMLMEIIGLLLLAGLGLGILNGVVKRHQEKKRLEAQTQAQLQLEAQRFEKIREILTDGVIEGSPKALDALKPMVEIMVEQLKGEEATTRMRLAHQMKLEEIKTLQEPFRLYMKQIDSTQAGCNNSSSVERELKALSEATQKVFPQLSLPVADEEQEVLALPVDPELTSVTGK